MEIMVHLNDEVLTWLTILELYFQIRLYSAKLGLRASIYAFVGMVGVCSATVTLSFLLEEWTVRTFTAKMAEER